MNLELSNFSDLLIVSSTYGLFVAVLWKSLEKFLKKIKSDLDKRIKEGEGAVYALHYKGFLGRVKYWLTQEIFFLLFFIGSFHAIILLFLINEKIKDVFWLILFGDLYVILVLIRTFIKGLSYYKNNVYNHPIDARLLVFSPLPFLLGLPFNYFLGGVGCYLATYSKSFLMLSVILSCSGIIFFFFLLPYEYFNWWRTKRRFSSKEAIKKEGEKKTARYKKQSI